MFGLFKSSGRVSKPTQLWPLDQRLWSWSKQDHHTLADSFGNIAGFGATGSGKSSGPAEKIGKAHLTVGAGGMFTTAKPDDFATYQRWCKECNRSQDVAVMGPESNRCFNILNHEMQTGGGGAGSTRNCVKLLLNVSEVRGRDSNKGGGGGGENGEYFQNAKEEMLTNAIDALSMAKKPVSVPSIYALINSAPNSIEEARDPAWRKSSFCWEVLMQASLLEKNEERLKDLDLSATYWLVSYPRLNDRTRTNITSSVTGVMDLLNRSWLRRLYSGETNITPEDVAHGKVVLHSASAKEYGEEGILSQVIFKFALQRAIERRNVRLNPRPVFLQLDEFQLFSTSYDSSFAGTCRSARVSFVIFTQNLSGVHSALGGGDKAKCEAASLYGNTNLKIFCANSEITTNQMAADMVGRRRDFLVNASGGGPRSDLLTRAFGGMGSGLNSGVSESLQYELEPSSFAKLRTGGVRNNRCVDVILYRTGAPFRASGRNWMKTTFVQR